MVKDNNSGLYLVMIVAIVAVVALFLMVKSGSSEVSGETVMVADEEGNLVGEAFRGYRASSSMPSIQTDYRSSIKERDYSITESSEEECLKDYEIHAYALKSIEEQGYFIINEDSFTLTIDGENKKLNDGAVISLSDSLFQDYAGGFKGVGFDIVGACSSDFVFNYAHAHSDSTYHDAYFSISTLNLALTPISSEDNFNLDIGESYTLKDGSKIILKDTLKQDYAGGMNGIIFELICKN